MRAKPPPPPPPNRKRVNLKFYFRIYFWFSEFSLNFRLLFDIQIGFLDADVMTELSAYETNSWVTNVLESTADYFNQFD